MEERRDIEIDELIARCLSHELRPGEGEQLERWLAEDEEHVRYFTRCRNLHDLYSPAFPPEGIDEKKAYRQVDARVRGRSLRRRRWTTVAAAVVGGLALGMGWWLSRQAEVTPQVQVVQRVEQQAVPQGIVLELAEGQVIALDSLREGEGAYVGMSALRDEDAIAYAQGDSVETEVWHTWIVPRGKTFFLTLGDGTRVWMNSESTIRFPMAFRGGERRVCIEGEAYLEVAHDASRPFRVELQGGEVTVLGTAFNVRSYQGEGEQVTLVEGKVQVLAAKEELVLDPGEQAVWEGDGGMPVKRRVNPALYCSWHEGKWLFENGKLEDIMALVARRYDLQVEWETETLKNVRFSGEIRHSEQVEDVLRLVELADDMSFELEGQKIRVKHLR